MLNTHQITPMKTDTSTECLNAVRKMLNILKDTQNEDQLRIELDELRATLIASDEVIASMRNELIEARQIQFALTNALAHAPAHAHPHTHPPTHTNRTEHQTPRCTRKLREHVAKLRIKTQSMADDQARLRYAISTVSGLALNQVAAFVGNDKINLTGITY